MLSTLSKLLVKPFARSRKNKTSGTASREVDTTTSPSDGAVRESIEPGYDKTEQDHKPVIKTKRRTATETFIVVRPPPSKSNHPFNLQIQIVPPTNKRQPEVLTPYLDEYKPNNNSSTESLPQSTTRSWAPSIVSRAGTLWSIAANSNIATNSTSMINFSMNTSGFSARRLIVPLYNLHAHNVLTNVVTDAGTDANIAKFLKQRLELTGLMTLELYEVYGGYTWRDEMDSLNTAVDGSNPATSPPSVLRLEARMRGVLPSPQERPSTYVWVVRKWMKGLSNESRRGLLDRSKNQVNAVGSAADRKNLTVNASVAGNSVDEVTVEVRFEWKRSDKKKSNRVSDARNGDAHKTTQEIGGRQDNAALEEQLLPVNVSKSDTNPPSSSIRPSSTYIGPLNDISRGGPDTSKGFSLPSTSDEGERPDGPVESKEHHGVTRTNVTFQANPNEEESDSDPEDSERPWTCYLHIRSIPRVKGPPSRTETTVDIKPKVAVLAPTPHHPKVVAQVKVPYPLPDVIFEAGYGARLKARADEVEEDDDRKDRALRLTAEEIKDVINCTALWLIIREGYGGLARTRKGDGWKIRG